jgi:hypothetical protein
MDPLNLMVYDSSPDYHHGDSDTESASEGHDELQSDLRPVRVVARSPDVVEMAEADSSQQRPSTPSHQMRRFHHRNSSTPGQSEVDSTSELISKSSGRLKSTSVATVPESVSSLGANFDLNCSIDSEDNNIYISQELKEDGGYNFVEHELPSVSDSEDENEIPPTLGQGRLDRRRKRGAPPLIATTPKRLRSTQRREQLPDNIDTFLDLR